MVDNVVAALFSYLDRVSQQDLLSLDGENIEWLPRLGTLLPETAVREFQRVLADSGSMSHFLQRIAWLMCWLMERNKIRPWLLYRFGASFLQANHASLLEGVASILKRPGYRMTIQVRHRGGAYYACMINGYTAPVYVGNVVMCLVFWPGQSFAAAYVGRVSHQRQLADALHYALNGETVELLDGLHTDLGAAFRMGCRNLISSVMYRRAAGPPPGEEYFVPQQQRSNVPGRRPGGFL
ncbi:uncharacterized protein LOC142564204 [Dermacentor variabilis]|uniref:uncharacterized protein LOC142564204 n=1 Tax=Dermacentor variabilis TaxID=34621 RepID=UPI003F5B390E